MRLPLFAACCLIAVFARGNVEIRNLAPLEGGDIEGTVFRAEVVDEALGERAIYIRLPENYDAAAEARFPVLYMHDGRNLFTRSLAFGGEEWGIDETLTRLAKAGLARDAIVVGIDTARDRVRVLAPQKAVTLARGTWRESAMIRDAKSIGGDLDGTVLLADAYLRFVVNALKPAIDSRFRTLPDRDNTMVAGSSMGGLASLYAICEYPEVFGGAACVSSHWPIGDGLMLPYLEKTGLPAPDSHRLYFDFGTETLDASYEPYQAQVDKLVAASGYRPGVNWVTRKFPGADHSEAAWRARADIILTFLLAPR